MQIWFSEQWLNFSFSPLWNSVWMKLGIAQNIHIPCDGSENQTLKLENLWSYKQNQQCKAKQRLEKRPLDWK
jgi:hypothetical protein